jgi:hypothetical protein
VVEERSRLDRLRFKFLARWKKHWATRRAQVDDERRQLGAEWDKLNKDRATLQQERARADARSEVATRRIEHGWRELRAAERAFQTERENHQSAIEMLQRDLADQQARHQAEAIALKAERMAIEHRSADLRVEADGIESRVMNLRAVLLRLEAERAQASPSSNSRHEAAARPSANATEAALGELAETLHDQRLMLVEQTHRLAEAREHWREEQSALVAEIAQLAEQLRRREERIHEDEKAIGFEREQIDRETDELNELKDRLLARQTRLEAIEAGWRCELGRRELALQARERELTRREQGLKELCRRWGTHRRAEILSLRDARDRSARLAIVWLERATLLADRERAIDRREADSIARALVLEKSRQKLLAAAPEPELAAKKIERLERQMTRRLARSRARDAVAHSLLTEERIALVDHYRRSEELAEQLAERERELNIRRLYVDREELAEREEQARQAEMLEQWRVERDMYERERHDLRDEVERLAGLLLRDDRPAVAYTARAA